ncbi:MAG TPA: hypothetical protein VFJ82_15660, partial [Longimicrobium sp.]|nr:hypothetical protein [Longimicrobium sp.]
VRSDPLRASQTPHGEAIVPYTLNIEFAGLCLFVAQASTGAGVPNKMHVVMPVRAGGGEHSLHRHVPLLVFNTGHLNGKAPVPGVDAHVLLRDLFFELPGTGASLKICPDIADLTPVTTGHPLIPGVLEDSDLITTRFTLVNGEMTGLFAGACWEWTAGEVRRIAHRVRWTAKMPDEELSLELKGLHPEGDPMTITLKPLGTDPIITLEVHHSPPGDLPPEAGEPEEPALDEEAQHFGTYYSLFPAGTPVQVPKFKSVKACTPKGGTGCELLGDQGGSPYTCMVAGYTGP